MNKYYVAFYGGDGVRHSYFIKAENDRVAGDIVYQEKVRFLKLSSINEIHIKKVK